jgi:hypothetical protein
VLEKEQEDFAQLLKLLDFDQYRAEAFANLFRRYASMPLTYVIDNDRLQAQTEAAMDQLEKRFGVTGAPSVIAAAKGALSRVQQHWPGLMRLLTTNGAGSDVDVIIAFRDLAKSKLWG